MKHLITTILLLASFTSNAGCEGGSCVGHKGKLEWAPTAPPVQP